jgi:hypothetical protein
MKRKSVQAGYSFRTALLSDFCMFRMFRKAINRKKKTELAKIQRVFLTCPPLSPVPEK